MLIGKRIKAPRDRVQPTGIGVGQRAGKQCSSRPRPHGRHVRQIHCQRFVPERFRIDIGEEVPAGDQHVDGHCKLPARRWREQCCIVTDA